jgi:hypothetical protein
MHNYMRENQVHISMQKFCINICTLIIREQNLYQLNVQRRIQKKQIPARKNASRYYQAQNLPRNFKINNL